MWNKTDLLGGQIGREMLRPKISLKHSWHKIRFQVPTSSGARRCKALESGQTNPVHFLSGGEERFRWPEPLFTHASKALKGSGAGFFPELDVPIGQIKEMLPAIVVSHSEVDLNKWPPLRAFWFANQVHAGLVGGPV